MARKRLVVKESDVIPFDKELKDDDFVPTNVGLRAVNVLVMAKTDQGSKYAVVSESMRTAENSCKQDIAHRRSPFTDENLKKAGVSSNAPILVRVGALKQWKSNRSQRATIREVLKDKPKVKMTNYAITKALKSGAMKVELGGEVIGGHEEFLSASKFKEVYNVVSLQHVIRCVKSGVAKILDEDTPPKENSGDIEKGGGVSS